MSKTKTTRDKILDAALDLFCKNGYNGTTTKGIADKAGVNELTLFRHFGSKEKLFLEVIDREGNNVHRIVKELDPHFAPTDDMVADLTHIGIYMTENMILKARVMKLVMVEKDAHPELWKNVSKAPFDALALISSYFETAKQRGQIRDIDTDIIAVAFFSFFFRTMVSNAFLEKDVFIKMDRANIRKYADIFVKGILND